MMGARETIAAFFGALIAGCCALALIANMAHAEQPLTRVRPVLPASDIAMAAPQGADPQADPQADPREPQQEPQDGQAPVKEALDLAYEAPETDSAVWYAPEWYWEPQCASTEPYAPSDGLTREGGVNYFGGRTETYYSSNVLYHVDTPEWTLDDEGFYRDAEGRYVVAASDMERGAVFEGSKGECVVLDAGCAPGVTDYYVGW